MHEQANTRSSGLQEWMHVEASKQVIGEGCTLASCQVDGSERVQVCLPITPTSPPCRLHRLTVQSCDAISSKSCPSIPLTPAQRTLLIPDGCARQQDSCMPQQQSGPAVATTTFVLTSPIHRKQVTQQRIVLAADCFVLPNKAEHYATKLEKQLRQGQGTALRPCMQQPRPS